MKSMFKDEAEKRRYLRFYAYLSKYPDIKAIYAQEQDSELKEGVIKALGVAFDLFEERENEINQKAIEDFARECKNLTADFKDVAFDLFLALSAQREQMQELQSENERLALTFLTTKEASNEAK